MPEQQTEEVREAIKNIHLEVPASFHQRLRVLCVLKETTLKEYGLKALEEKVARDDSEIKGSKK